jgi:molybdopterin-guanine dinucleotide biosynthesis protein A
LLSETGWIEIAGLPALPSTAGVVLAGGRSTRFGRAKAQVEVAGVPMLRRVVEVLGACCDEVVLIAAPEGAEVLDPGFADSTRVPVRVLHDASAHAGPAAALAGALPRIGAELAFVSGCDSPLLAPTLLRGLLALAAQSPGWDVVAPDRGMGLEPLLAVYRVAAMGPALAAAIRNGSIRLVDALAGVRSLRVADAELAVLDPDGASFLNVNRPADLEAVDRQLARCRVGQLYAGAGPRSST